MLRTDPGDPESVPVVCYNGSDSIFNTNNYPRCPDGFSCEYNAIDGDLGNYHCCSDPLPGEDLGPIGGDDTELCYIPGNGPQMVMRNFVYEPYTCDPMALSGSPWTCPAGYICQNSTNPKFPFEGGYVCCSSPETKPGPGPMPGTGSNSNTSVNNVDQKPKPNVQKNGSPVDGESNDTLGA